MRLRLMSEYFSAREAATGRLLAELVAELLRQRADLQVSVISGRRPYRAQTETLAASEVQQSGRLRVVRLGRTGWRSRGATGRIADDLVFTLGSALSGWAGPRSDVTLVTTSPATLPLAALGLWRLRREPYVYLMYDVYPDIAVASGFIRRTSWSVRGFAALQRLMSRQAAAVIVLGDCMAEELVKRYDVARDKVHVVPNWWSPVYLGHARTRPTGAPLTLTYAGNLGHAQEFSTLLDALPGLLGDVHVEFIGEGERRADLEARVQREGHGRASFLPYLSEEDLASHLHTATDVALVTLNAEVSGLAVPSKTYNLLAAGLPLLAVMSEHGEIARMIRRSGCGVVVSPGDTAGLQAAVLRLRDPAARAEMARRARALADEFTLARASARMLGVLESVAGASGGVRPPADEGATL